jgi:hypothetical protein
MLAFCSRRIEPVRQSNRRYITSLRATDSVLATYRCGSPGTQTSGVGMDRAAEIVLQYLLLTYSYGINYRKIKLVSRSL